MQNQSRNPFEVIAENSSERSPARVRSFRARFGLIGAIVGVSIPLWFAVPVLSERWSRPPAPPGTAYSGTSQLIAMLIVLVGCPVSGVVAALIGAACGAFADWRVLAARTASSEASNNSNGGFNSP